MQSDFQGIVQRACGYNAVDCDACGTSLQITCGRQLTAETDWLTKRLQWHTKQRPILYGFFDSFRFQAHAIDDSSDSSAAIAVSPFCIVSLGSYFDAALADAQILAHYGNSAIEKPAAELATIHVLNRKPLDQRRREVSSLLRQIAMRFLTAHELSHILHGHIRWKRSQGEKIVSMAESPYFLSTPAGLVSQTLEIDADAGAMHECLPDIIFAEKEPHLKPGDDVFKKPEDALALWLFAVYSLYRIMAADAPQQIAANETLSHPPAMLRFMSVAGALLEFLRKSHLDRLESLFLGSLGRAIEEGERAYALILGVEVDVSAARQAIEDQNHMTKLLQTWGDIRPHLELLSSSRGRLAPVQFCDLGM